ncbi:hypothetical protein PHYPSEUDO_015256 [Phytophthora pseudosyringae]|uniref:Uncharacterized protein n=1 Tax=Phytophthora pseudosyringae TaxID=221518 RepID=A0A8T1V4B0_9STRA|nr:hypothetical protein PHYPSEUDO_015256 [Phytophthora pseudosyringae]
MPRKARDEVEMQTTESSSCSPTDERQPHSSIRAIRHKSTSRRQQTAMKFSTIVAFAITIEAGLLQASAQTLVITTEDCSSCSVGTYCTNSAPECHGPPATGACFNATISEYQVGCGEGYDCFDNMCECVIDDTPVATTPTPTTATPTTAAPTTAAPTRAPSPTSTVVTSSAGIYSQCPSGTYWEIGATACRGPSYAGECYNPSTAKYQNGCAAGFTCSNNKCSTIPPATFSPTVCYLRCSSSVEYCENGTNVCRGPNYAGECFNAATGHFQNGCGAGYECANNMCVKA